MASQDQELQPRPEAEQPKKPPAEKPPGELDVAIEAGNWNVVDEKLLEEKKGAVVEVRTFAESVANDPELGTLSHDQDALVDRETSDAHERATTEIKTIRQAAGEVAPAAPASPPEKPPESAVVAEAVPAAPPAPPSEKLPQVPDLVVSPPQPTAEVAQPVVEPAAPALPHVPNLITPEAEAAQAAEQKALEAEAEAQLSGIHAEAMPNAAEEKAQARMKEILQEMDGLRLKIKENPPDKQALLQRRQALALEGRNVQEEIKKLAAEKAKQEQAAQAPVPSSEVIQPQRVIEAGFTAEEQAEAVRSSRNELGALARELRDGEGYMTDEMVEKFKQLRNRVDDLQTRGADMQGVQEMMHHFGMLLNAEASPDAPDRLKGLNEFFNENPDLASEAAPETDEERFARMAKEADAAYKAGQEEQKKKEEIERRQQEAPKMPKLEDIKGLVDVLSTAPEIGEADFKSFFEDYNGAEYGMALKNLDAVMGQRDAKIKELLALKPEGEERKKKIQEQIACLQLANRISAMRKEQWAKQDGLFKAQKALELDGTAILETQQEISEVASMLEANPNDENLQKRKAQLEQQLEFQEREQSGRLAAIETQKKEIESLGSEIARGIKALEGLKQDIDKPAAEDPIWARPTTTELPSPEEMLEKGINRLGEGFATLGSQDDIGEMAFGAIGKIFSALEWAVDKVPGGTKGGAASSSKKS
ncbi:hypothetical protein HZC53_02220 [Candidatus Uhrbacteria bacterium]|nr:hypothetical protein [Candidatus Uhrbacteria bacterium]